MGNSFVLEDAVEKGPVIALSFHKSLKLPTGKLRNSSQLGFIL
jgi:hypothetical protein